MAEAAAPAAAAPQQTYEERDAESDEITRVIDVDKDDAPFILGRGGATKRKVARVSCTEIELDEHTLTITIQGKRDDCDRAQDYLGFVKQQRLGARRRPQGTPGPLPARRPSGRKGPSLGGAGPVYIDFENQKREDFSAYAVPDDCIGFVMGRSGQTLRTYEDEWGASLRRRRWRRLPRDGPLCRGSGRLPSLSFFLFARGARRAARRARLRRCSCSSPRR